MSATQFEIECGARLIDPAVALENDDLRQALQDRDDAAVKAILDEDF
jgi:hypothetical protein